MTSIDDTKSCLCRYCSFWWSKVILCIPQRLSDLFCAQSDYRNDEQINRELNRSALRKQGNLYFEEVHFHHCTLYSLTQPSPHSLCFYRVDQYPYPPFNTILYAMYRTVWISGWPQNKTKPQNTKTRCYIISESVISVYFVDNTLSWKCEYLSVFNKLTPTFISFALCKV